MVEIQFKNMYPSTLAKDMVLKRLIPVLEKFSISERCRVFISVELKNNSDHQKSDEFNLLLKLSGKEIGKFQLKKSAVSLTQAACELSDTLEKQLNEIISSL